MHLEQATSHDGYGGCGHQTQWRKQDQALVDSYSGGPPHDQHTLKLVLRLALVRQYRRGVWRGFWVAGLEYILRNGVWATGHTWPATRPIRRVSLHDFPLKTLAALEAVWLPRHADGVNAENCWSSSITLFRTP